MVDGRIVQDAPNPRFDFVQGKPGRHRVTVTAIVDGRPVATDAWQVAVVAPPPPDAAQGVPSAPPEGASAPGRLAEEEVRRWLDDYARAWSRKDVGTLQRMGQVRSTTEAERLERYFHSIDDLHVDVRVIALRVEGGQAVVDFERTDTVTDPAGQRRQLRLPPFHKEIERTPGGLRFRGGEG
jgi:hypothetical protein